MPPQAVTFLSRLPWTENASRPTTAWAFDAASLWTSASLDSTRWMPGSSLTAALIPLSTNWRESLGPLACLASLVSFDWLVGFVGGRGRLGGRGGR